MRDSRSAGQDRPALPTQRAWLAGAILAALTGWAAPAAAQSGIYGFESSYRLYSGAAARQGSASGRNWQPGASNVYPPGRVWEPPRPSVDVGAGSAGTGYASAGAASASATTTSGTGYGSGGGVYGTVPRGSLPDPSAVRGASARASRTAPLPPAAPPVRTAAATPASLTAADDDYDDYYDEDGPPLPVHRTASGGKGVDPKFNRHMVSYTSSDPPGTIIVDTGARFLYLIQPGGKAVRYGIGVGKEGFAWSGTQRISDKREWPDWRPPAEMIARRPDLPNEMPGGPDNPLGARALYLGDTLYRIHGSNEPETIGQAVSSGCIRMRNEDVIDLYDRVPVGTLVRVI